MLLKNITLINDRTVNELEFSKRLQNIFIVLLTTPLVAKENIVRAPAGKTAKACINKDMIKMVIPNAGGCDAA